MKSSRPPVKIVGTGLVALDVIYVDEADKPGLIATGGTAGNVLTILGALGWSATPIARLANDRASGLIKAELKKWNLDLSLLQTAPQAATPIIIERLRRDPNPSHSFSWTCPCCGGWLPRFAPVGIRSATALMASLPPADVFFFDRPFPAALKFAEHYASSGATVVFEPSGKGDPEVFRKALDVAHVVKYAADRFSRLPAELDELPNACIEIQTLGANGLRYRTRIGRAPSAWKHEPSFAVAEVVDTAGSGDWFTAGFLGELFKDGRRLGDVTSGHVASAITYAQALAAWNCRFVGARGGMNGEAWARMPQEVDDILTQRIVKLSAGRRRQASRGMEEICPACTAEPRKSRRASASTGRV